VSCMKSLTPKLFPPFLIITLLAETTTTTTPSPIEAATIQAVADLFVKLVPWLLFLAALSILFGFIKNITKNFNYLSKYVKPGLLLALVLVSPIPLATAATSQSQSIALYFDVPAAGLYYIPTSYSVSRVIDAYGNSVSVYYVPQSDWYTAGYIVYLGPGRYNVITGQSSLPLYQPNMMITYTYSLQTPSSITVSEVNNTQIHDITSSLNHYVNITINISGGLKVYQYTPVLFKTGVFRVLRDTQLSIRYSLTVSSTAPSGCSGATTSILVNSSSIYSFSAIGSFNALINLSQGYYTVRVEITDPGTCQYFGGVNAVISLAGSYIVKEPQYPAQVYLQQYTVPVVATANTVKTRVYAHNVTLQPAGDPTLKYIILPVDINEVSALTQLNPVVYDPALNVVRPARLVNLHGADYLVFQAWSNTTQYTIIWNYPNTVPLDTNIFVDDFAGDPLLTWSYSGSSISRVEYDKSNRELDVYGSSHVFTLQRDVGFNANGVLTYIQADYAYVYTGNVSYIPQLATTQYIAFIAGTLYNTTAYWTTGSIEYVLTPVYTSTDWSTGSVVTLYASSVITSILGGVVAVPDMIPYNASVSRNLLRLDMNVEYYTISYSIPSNVGYWKYVVQATIYYDPSYLPPNQPYFNVWLELPEQLWLQQGYVKPGLADIAVTTADGKLLKFWIEPYLLPNGYRRVWLKLPADPARNIYIVNILLGNDMLQSSLSTLEAFIEYYDENMGLSGTWSSDKYGFTVTSNPYVNTIVAVPKTLPSFKLGLTVDDFFNVTAYGVVEVHSAYSEQVYSSNGMVLSGLVHYIYWSRDGRLQYYQGNSLLYEATLSSKYAWPPVVVGFANARQAGLAILVPFTYSIGTITGGQWNPVTVSPVVQGGSSFSWSAMGGMILAMLPLLILAIVFRLVQSPPGVSVSKSKGVI